MWLEPNIDGMPIDHHNFPIDIRLMKENMLFRYYIRIVQYDVNDPLHHIYLTKVNKFITLFYKPEKYYSSTKIFSAVKIIKSIVYKHEIINKFGIDIDLIECKSINRNWAESGNIQYTKNKRDLRDDKLNILLK